MTSTSVVSSVSEQTFALPAPSSERTPGAVALAALGEKLSALASRMPGSVNAAVLAEELRTLPLPLLRTLPLAVGVAEVLPQVVWEGGDVEIVVIGWRPGVPTKVHDHGTAVGAFRVVSGALLEDVFEPGTLRFRRQCWRAGEVGVVPQGAVHRVQCPAGAPVSAVSVHVYVRSRGGEGRAAR